MHRCIMRRKRHSKSPATWISLKLKNSLGAATGTQVQGTGNRISVDPHVPELAVDLERAWQLLDIWCPYQLFWSLRLNILKILCMHQALWQRKLVQKPKSFSSAHLRGENVLGLPTNPREKVASTEQQHPFSVQAPLSNFDRLFRKNFRSLFTNSSL